MSLPRSVAEVLAEHVTLEVEGIDRMYLNVYIPGLQREQGVACFFRFHRGHQFASSALMDPISKTFVAALQEFAQREKIPVIQFRKGQRKDSIAAEQRKKFLTPEGVVFIGKAQEKTPGFRTERRRNEKTGITYPWLVRSTAMVNHFYIYCVDRDFGPFFLKFSTYFPYNAKLCLNGHEYAKQQLLHRASRSRLWTMESCAARIPNGCRPSAMDSAPLKSTPYCGNGCDCCRIRMWPGIARLATAIRFPFCRLSSR